MERVALDRPQSEPVIRHRAAVIELPCCAATNSPFRLEVSVSFRWGGCIAVAVAAAACAAVAIGSVDAAVPRNAQLGALPASSAAARSFYSTPFERRPDVPTVTALGRALFADASLSASGRVACAS